MIVDDGARKHLLPKVVVVAELATLYIEQEQSVVGRQICRAANNAHAVYSLVAHILQSEVGYVIDLVVVVQKVDVGVAVDDNKSLLLGAVGYVGNVIVGKIVALVEGYNLAVGCVVREYRAIAQGVDYTIAGNALGCVVVRLVNTPFADFLRICTDGNQQNQCNGNIFLQ